MFANVIEVPPAIAVATDESMLFEPSTTARTIADRVCPNLYDNSRPTFSTALSSDVAIARELKLA
jgi:hypothetical protein